MDPKRELDPIWMMFGSDLDDIAWIKDYRMIFALSLLVRHMSTNQPLTKDVVLDRFGTELGFLLQSQMHETLSAKVRVQGKETKRARSARARVSSIYIYIYI